MKTVACVVVTYHPQLQKLADTLGALVEKVGRVVVYDNSELPGCADTVRNVCESSGTTYLGGDGNIGIAAAQNLAVSHLAMAGSTEFVVFFDQDSTVPGDLVQRLFGSFRRLRLLDRDAGILGVMPVDEDGCPYDMKVLAKLGPVWRVALVISSGSIMRIADLQSAGGFRDDLFIDLVDTDICRRMQARGQFSYVDPAITLKHTVGSGHVVRAIGRSAPVSAPFRNYYQIRNLLLLGRSGVLSWREVCSGLVMRVGVVVLSASVEGRLAERLRFIGKGAWHGYRGRGGRLV